MTASSKSRRTKFAVAAHPQLPCPGSAHDPDVGGMIDNCTTCAPRWGQVPAYVGASPDARFVLRMLGDSKSGRVDGPGIPKALFDVMPELQRFGYVEVFSVTLKKRTCTTSFMAWRLTSLGQDAAQRMGR